MKVIFCSIVLVFFCESPSWLVKFFAVFMTAAARYLVAGYYEVYAIFTHQSYFIIGVSTKTYLETSVVSLSWHPQSQLCADAFTLTRILKRISERNMKTANRFKNTIWSKQIHYCLHNKAKSWKSTLKIPFCTRFCNNLWDARKIFVWINIFINEVHLLHLFCITRKGNLFSRDKNL